LTLHADGKAYFADTLTSKRSREIIHASALLLASLAILASPAHAQQCGSKLPNLTFDSRCGGGPSPRSFDRENPQDREFVTSRPDNMGEDKHELRLESEPEEDSNIRSNKKLRRPKPPDLNREIFYRNKLEFSLDGGWLPINIPFPLDIFVGDAYNSYPLKYTLAPIFASLRWHITDVGSPWILRGNWDMTFTGSITAVPRGPESRYFAYLMGIRRNFVPRNWRATPYFDVRLGVGNIDAKGPLGVLYAQGQDLTFTVNMGSGVRYNFDSRYSISAGLNFMHISNLDLSESNGKPNWGVRNYGINVYGPMVGFNVNLRKRRSHSE
jgi:Lipid A 3-O-deacylase (PagL)